MEKNEVKSSLEEFLDHIVYNPASKTEEKDREGVDTLFKIFDLWMHTLPKDER